MNEKLRTAIRHVNVVHALLDHTLGEKHSHSHRIIVGLFVAGLGVSIAKSAHSIDIHVVQYFADGLGYFVHSLGCLPLVDAALSAYRNNE